MKPGSALLPGWNGELLENRPQPLYFAGAKFAHPARVKVGHRVLEPYNEARAGRGNPGHDDAPVIHIACPARPPAVLEPIEQPGDIGIPTHRPLGDGAAWNS